eukprot:SAG31_NODE_1041_length_10203_cov_1.922902_4_plen_1524_part_00
MSSFDTAIHAQKMEVAARESPRLHAAEVNQRLQAVSRAAKMRLLNSGHWGAAIKPTTCTGQKTSAATVQRGADGSPHRMGGSVSTALDDGLHVRDGRAGDSRGAKEVSENDHKDSTCGATNVKSSDVAVAVDSAASKEPNTCDNFRMHQARVAATRDSLSVGQQPLQKMPIPVAHHVAIACDLAEGLGAGDEDSEPQAQTMGQNLPFLVVAPGAVTKELDVEAWRLTAEDIVATVQCGERIAALAVAMTKRGQWRVKTERGWISTKSSYGKPILQPLPSHEPVTDQKNVRLSPAAAKAAAAVARRRRDRDLVNSHRLRGSIPWQAHNFTHPHTQAAMQPSVPSPVSSIVTNENEHNQATACAHSSKPFAFSAASKQESQKNIDELADVMTGITDHLTTLTQQQHQQQQQQQRQWQQWTQWQQQHPSATAEQQHRTNDGPPRNVARGQQNNGGRDRRKRLEREQQQHRAYDRGGRTSQALGKTAVKQVEHCGYLKKQSGGHRAGKFGRRVWANRFFVLSGGRLSWYLQRVATTAADRHLDAHADARERRGCIVFAVLPPGQIRISGTGRQIEISTGAIAPIRMLAIDAADAELWRSRLRQAIAVAQGQYSSSRRTARDCNLEARNSADDGAESELSDSFSLSDNTERGSMKSEHHRRQGQGWEPYKLQPQPAPAPAPAPESESQPETETRPGPEPELAPELDQKSEPRAESEPGQHRQTLHNDGHGIDASKDDIDADESLVFGSTTVDLLAANPKGLQYEDFDLREEIEQSARKAALKRVAQEEARRQAESQRAAHLHQLSIAEAEAAREAAVERERRERHRQLAKREMDLWSAKIDNMVRKADERRRLNAAERRSVEALAEEQSSRHYRQEQERMRQQVEVERQRREAAELIARHAQDDAAKARQEAAQQQIDADRVALRKAEQLLVQRAQEMASEEASRTAIQQVEAARALDVLRNETETCRKVSEAQFSARLAETEAQERARYEAVQAEAAQLKRAGTERAAKRFFARMIHETSAGAFMAWLEYTAWQRRERALVAKLVGRHQKRVKKAVFSTWRRDNSWERKHDGQIRTPSDDFDRGGDCLLEQDTQLWSLLTELRIEHLAATLSGCLGVRELGDIALLEGEDLDGLYGSDGQLLRPVERRKLLLALDRAKVLSEEAEKARKSGEKKMLRLAKEHVSEDTWKKLGDEEKELVVAAVRERQAQVDSGALPAAALSRKSAGDLSRTTTTQAKKDQRSRGDTISNVGQKKSGGRKTASVGRRGSITDIVAGMTTKSKSKGSPTQDRDIYKSNSAAGVAGSESSPVVADVESELELRTGKKWISYKAHLTNQLLLLGPPAGAQPVQLGASGTEVVPVMGSPREFNVWCPSMVSSEPDELCFRASTAQASQEWQRRLLQEVHGFGDASASESVPPPHSPLPPETDSSGDETRPRNWGEVSSSDSDAETPKKILGSEASQAPQSEPPAAAPELPEPEPEHPKPEPPEPEPESPESPRARARARAGAGARARARVRSEVRGGAGSAI